MIIENYNDGVKALIAQIQELRRVGDPAIMDSLDTLLKIATRMNDHALIGYAYHYLADAFFSVGYSYDRFQTYLTAGLQHQMLSGDNELLARSYNLVSIDAVSHGSYDLCINALSTARSYSDKLPSSALPGIIASNTGSAYQRIGDADTAIRYYEEALRLTTENPADSMRQRNIVGSLSMIGTLHLHAGDTSKAQECYAQITQEESAPGAPPYIFEETGVLIFHCMMAHHLEQTKQFHSLLTRVGDSLTNIATFTDFSEDVFYFADYLLEHRCFEELDLLIAKIRAALSMIQGYLVIHVQLQRLIIRYAEVLKDDAMRLTALKEFYRCSVLHDKDLALSCIFSVEMSELMKKQRAEQMNSLEDDLRRRHAAQTDALTGLPNMVYLLERIENALDKSSYTHVNLGLSVIGIPAELAADLQNMKNIAAVLATLINTGVSCTKGDGEEFLILYENMTDADILQYAQMISERLQPFVGRFSEPQRKGILRFLKPAANANPLPHGLCTGIPDARTGAFDYLSRAAEAMTRSKNTSPGRMIRVALSSE